jgi:outer membrane lipoprotein SlyB
MASRDCAIGIFELEADAKSVVAKLQRTGWHGDQISLITRGNESELESIGPLRQGDRMEKTAAIGSAAGAAIGLLASSSLFIVPGVGAVLFAGAIASGITGGLVGGLLGAMSGWGVKESQIRKYEQALRQGKSLVVLTGDPTTLAAGEEELLAANAEEVVLHAETADSARVDE